MSLKSSETKNKGSGGLSAPLLDVGGYPARVVIVADLGMQEQNPFEGKPKKPAQEVLLTYELSDEFMLDENGEPMKDKPRWFTENFALFDLDADKAKSTARSKAIDPAGVHKGDYSKYVGAPVMIGIGHKPGTGKKVGQTVEKILTVTAVRAKDAASIPQLVNEGLWFDLDAPDVAVFKKLSPWVQEKIMKNLEYGGSKLEKLLGKGYKPERKAADDKPAPAVETKIETPANEEDDRPF